MKPPDLPPNTAREFWHSLDFGPNKERIGHTYNIGRRQMKQERKARKAQRKKERRGLKTVNR